MIEQGAARTVSLLEEAPEPNEAAFLKRLGVESLLMVCLPAAGSCWGLVEAYADRKLFDQGDAELAGADRRGDRRAGDRLDAGV